MCRGGVPPTPLNPGAGCRSREDVSSRFWVKFPTRLERSGALERAGCRCHSWVIQEINWGLGWEAASKRTLRSDLPLAPVRSRCQKLREMLLGGARHPSHQHPQPSVTSQQTCPREGPPQPSTPQSPWKKKKNKKHQNQTKIKPNQSSRPGLPRDKDGSGSIWEVLPHAPARQRVWPQPSLGGCSTRRGWEAPLPASVSPFLHLSPVLLKHRGHEAQRGLDFSFSPKAPLSYKTLGDSLV